MPATLTTLRADAIRLTHDDVAYEPLADDASLGALLFALDLLERDAFDVAAMRYADRVALGPALEAARQYGLILRRHVDRADRTEPLLPAAVKVEHAYAWVHAAAAAVPEAERDRFCWRLARRLGDDPWGDGRPAIALANQQFGMFEEGFAEIEAQAMPGSMATSAEDVEALFDLPPLPAAESAADAAAAAAEAELAAEISAALESGDFAADAPDSRTDLRVKVAWPARMRLPDGQVIELQVRDISTRGVGLTSREHIPARTVANLEMDVPPLDAGGQATLVEGAIETTYTAAHGPETLGGATWQAPPAGLDLVKAWIERLRR